MQDGEHSDLKLLSEEEAAHLLRISTRSLRSFRAKGLIAYVKISSRRIAYRKEDIADYIRRNLQPAQEPLPPRSRTQSRTTISNHREKIVPFSQRNRLKDSQQSPNRP